MLSDQTIDAIERQLPHMPHRRLCAAARAVLLAAGLPDAVPGGAEYSPSGTARNYTFLWLAGQQTPGLVCVAHVVPDLTAVQIGWWGAGSGVYQAARLTTARAALQAAGWGVSPVQRWRAGGGLIPEPWTDVPGNPPWVLAWHTGLYRELIGTPDPAR